MADQLEQSLARITEKSRFLIERYKTVSVREKEASRRVAELEKELAEARKTIQRLTVENEYLTVASNFAPDRDSREHARSVIADLVREVDRCIADLNE